MSVVRGFNLWTLSNVTDKVTGKPITLRANKAAEDQFFTDELNTLFSNSSAAYLLQKLSGQGVWLRSIAVNSENSGYSGANPNAAIYSANGTGKNDSLLDSNDSRYEGSIGSLYTSPNLSPKTVSVNFKAATTNNYLSITGASFNVPTAFRTILHETLHARHQIEGSYFPEQLADGSSPYDEQITIFLENYITHQIDAAAPERATHLGFGGLVTGASKSSISYLNNSQLTDYTFERSDAPGDLTVEFTMADNSTITKTYYRGRTSGSALADYAGADRVEISLEGTSSLLSTAQISDSKVKEILKQSAVQNIDPLSDLKTRIAKINGYLSDQIKYKPQALVVLSGERIAEIGLDIEGPRPEADSFVQTAAKRKTFAGFDFLASDLDTLIFGSAGWVGTPGSSAMSVVDFAGSKDRLVGKGGDDILITYGNNDGNQLFGGGGDDALFGGSHADELNGDGGNDTLDGGDGADKLHGGSGNDVLFGQVGDDELYGEAGDDILHGGAGADLLDGGAGADILIVGGGDNVAQGEVEDRLYAGFYNPTNSALNLLTGGQRFCQVNDSQTFEQQLQAMRDNADPFIGKWGETYQTTNANGIKGLNITLKSGELVKLPKWQEGEYGIYLETTRERVFDYKPFPFAGGATTSGLMLGAATILFDAFTFIIDMNFDPLASKFNGNTYTLTRLDQLLTPPVAPVRTNNITGTEAAEEIHGTIGDNRILAGGGSDNVKGFGGADYISAGGGDDVIDGGDGADVIDAGSGDDIITGSTGDDDITTGAGNDVIMFNVGDGADKVHADENDVIRLGSGFSPQATAIYRRGTGTGVYGETASADVVVGAGADKITLDSGAFGRIEFADGTVKTSTTLARDSVAASETAGNDVIIGTFLSETLAGGRGNDYINGGGGNDRYQFARGDGQDRFEDGIVSADSLSDALVFAAGIAPTDIIVSTSAIATGPRAGQQLIRLAISGTTDWVEFPLGDIELVRFQDGTEWTGYVLSSRALQSLATSSADIIKVNGYAMAGEVRPGAGNDVVAVGAYGATIDFGIGSGSDRVDLSNIGQQPGYAAIVIDAGIQLSDLRFDRLIDGYAATIISSGDRIEFHNAFDGNEVTGLGGYFVVNGERVSNKLLAKLADLTLYAAAQQVGTAAANTLTGMAGGDRINGADGNDSISGNDGNDLLFGGAGNDIIFGGNGNDLLLGDAGDDQLDGGAGDDVLLGGLGTDTIAGGAGDDELTGTGTTTLKGDAGADRIVFSRGDKIVYNIGDGADYVTAAAPLAYAAAIDGSTTVKRSEITFGAGINAATTMLRLDGWSLTVLVNGSATDQIRLERLFQFGQLPQIRFADGTIWKEEEIYSRLFSPDNGDNAPAAIESIEPEYNNAVISYIYGGRGNDTLNYAPATERHFIFQPGGGNDVVTSDGSVQLYGFDLDAMRLERSGSGMADLTISFVGITDTLKILGQYAFSYPFTAHTAELDIDGARVYDSDLRKAYIAQHSTSGNDVIYGFDGLGGSYNGGLWQPAYYPNAGNDTYRAVLATIFLPEVLVMTLISLRPVMASMKFAITG